MANTEDNPVKAEQLWQESCRGLYLVYCRDPNLGAFIQKLILCKLTVFISDWDQFPHFQNNAKGCGICNHNDLDPDNKHMSMITHLFCECPVVLQALEDLRLHPILDISELAISHKRIKEPDKPRFAYGIFHFERELRRQGTDGHNRPLFIAFKQYIKYLLTPGNKTKPFSHFHRPENHGPDDDDYQLSQ